MLIERRRCRFEPGLVGLIACHSSSTGQSAVFPHNSIMPESTIYEVSLVEKQPNGSSIIRVLLRTKDREEANALVGSLEQDGVRCKMTIIPPGQVE